MHRLGLDGRDVVLNCFAENGGSYRLIGVDRSGALILTLARQGEPVQLVRLETSWGLGCGGGSSYRSKSHVCCGDFAR